MNGRRAVATALLGLIVLASPLTLACSDDDDTIRIYAASSLQDVLPELLDAYAAAEGGSVRFLTQFGGSQSLATQIELGAEVDLFIAANQLQADRIADLELASDTAPVATNRLVLAIAEDSPIDSLDDLAAPGTRIAVGAPDVPVGALTRLALDALEPALASAIRDNVVTEDPNVRIVLSRVELGEADAAFVYSTDIATAEDVRAIELPPSLNLPTNRYVGIVLNDARPGAHKLLAFLQTAEAQTILAGAGFGTPE